MPYVLTLFLVLPGHSDQGSMHSVTYNNRSACVTAGEADKAALGSEGSYLRYTCTRQGDLNVKDAGGKDP